MTQSILGFVSVSRNVRVLPGDIEEAAPPRKRGGELGLCVNDLCVDVLKKIFRFLEPRDRHSEVSRTFRVASLRLRLDRARELWASLQKERQAVAAFGVDCQSPPSTTLEATRFFEQVHRAVGLIRTKNIVDRPFPQYLWESACAELPALFRQLYEESVVKVFQADSYRDFQEKIAAGLALSKIVLPKRAVFCFPTEICQCKGLREIDVVQTDATDLYRDLQGQSYLTSSRFCLSLPSQIAQLTMLHTLRLSSSRLHSLPRQIGCLKNLRYLYVNDNALSEVPEEIGGCSALLELCLSANKLRELPASIGALSRLRVLSVSKNNLASLPISSKRLKKLRELHVNENPIDAAPICSWTNEWPALCGLWLDRKQYTSVRSRMPKSVEMVVRVPQSLSDLLRL